MWLLQPQLPKGIGLKIRDICTKYEKFVSFTQTFHRVGDDLVINGQKMWITNAFQVSSKESSDCTLFEHL